jgi:deoxyribonuclease-4
VEGSFDDDIAIHHYAEFGVHIPYQLVYVIPDGGYDIVGNLEGVIEEFDRVIGIEKLKAVHLNDSKNILGSRKDRHEKIGQGNIGLDAIVSFVSHPSLCNLPFILETPNEVEGYAEEIKMLKGIVG